MKKLFPLHPVVQWLIYAVCSVAISGGIAWWLGGKAQEKHQAVAQQPPPSLPPDCPEPGPEPGTEPGPEPGETAGSEGAPPVEAPPKTVAPRAQEAPEDGAAEMPQSPDEALDELSRRELVVPVQGIDGEDLGDTFDDPRSGGRQHKAIDILAPRKTPVLAVEAGRVAAILQSPRGGLSLYLYDTAETVCYFYAHLDGYAPGLEEGAEVTAGQVLGYVGTTGNAPDNVPHLHFAIHLLPPSKRCSRGIPLNPYEILGGS